MTPRYLPTLAAVGLALDVPQDDLDKWRKASPRSFEQGPEGYDAQAIVCAGQAYLADRPGTPRELLMRLKLEMNSATRQLDRIVERFAELTAAGGESVRVGPRIQETFKRAWQEIGVLLEGGPMTQEATDFLREIVEDAIEDVRAAGLDEIEKAMEGHTVL